MYMFFYPSKRHIHRRLLYVDGTTTDSAPDNQNGKANFGYLFWGAAATVATHGRSVRLEIFAK